MQPIVIGAHAKELAMLPQSDLEARLMAVQREVTSLTAEAKTQAALRDKAKEAYDVAAPDTIELRVLEYAKAEASLAATSILANDQRQELSLILWEFCRRAKASVTRDK